MSQARLDVSEFLAASALDGAEATAAAQGLLASLRDAVLLPDATVWDVDTLYEKLASESGGEEEISKLPSMRISDLSLEIERLTLEKTERDLGWRVNASVSASWADFRDQSGRDPGLQASVAVTFSKQLLGSSIREAASELEVKQSRLEGESEAKLHTFVRQLSNLEKTVEDREYACRQRKTPE